MTADPQLSYAYRKKKREESGKNNKWSIGMADEQERKKKKELK